MSSRKRPRSSSVQSLGSSTSSTYTQFVEDSTKSPSRPKRTIKHSTRFGDETIQPPPSPKKHNERENPAALAPRRGSMRGYVYENELLNTGTVAVPPISPGKGNTLQPIPAADQSQNGHADINAAELDEIKRDPLETRQHSAPTQHEIMDLDKSETEVVEEPMSLGLVLSKGEVIGSSPKKATEVPNPESEADEDNEDPVWEEFRMEQFEIVEQLPLELHRNFTLLREHEDETIVHSQELQGLLRQYIAHRTYVASQPSPSDVAPSDKDVDAEIKNSQREGGNNKEQTTATVQGALDAATARDDIMPVASASEIPPPSNLVYHPTLEAVATEQAIELDVQAVASSSKPSAAQDQGADCEIAEASSQSSKQGRLGPLPPQLHPDPVGLLARIEFLSREIIRNCEEKVALAVAGYNTVDRHIRSLDASVSSATMAVASQAGQTHAVSSSPAALTQLSKKKGKNKKNNKDNSQAKKTDSVAEGSGNGDFEDNMMKELGGGDGGMAIDPNEPRYCYCNQVSYGNMIACDNDDCKLEWFHLGCTGLSAAPQGKWFCRDCDTPKRKR